MVDIFESAKEKVMPEWAKFVNAGDSVQGVYCGKIVGQLDGYGNEQIIYQLLQEDGKVINVGFGLNKKVLHQDMAPVNFGQIVGFRYKGTITVKDKFGKPVNVKDFALHQDPEIVDKKWLEENKNNMPKVTVVTGDSPLNANVVNAKDEVEKLAASLKDTDNDVPFSSAGSLTSEDQLKVIVKLAKEKLSATDANFKEKVMEATGLAFIVANYEKITAALASK